MDIAKYIVEFGLTGLDDGYDVQELGNRHQGYLSGITQLKMSASSNVKETVGFISLELRRDGEREKYKYWRHQCKCCS